jgi:LysR family glycine cleavage system transcriptional activator
MSQRLPPLNALRAFEAAARHLSFKDAAKELSVTPTAISHQIKALEDFLEHPLFRRLTRSLELTPEGEALLPKVREGLACFAAGVEALRTQSAHERLVVIAPPSFATRWLVPRLQGFARRQPQVELHLVSSRNAIDVDHPCTPRAFEDVESPESAAQVAICFGTGHYAGFRTDKILSSGYVAVCSPRIMSGPHPLRAPEDIRHQVLLHDDTIANEHARPSWEEWLRLANVSGVDAHAGPHFRDSGLALAAAIDGLGVALASKPLAETEVAAGRLVVPFDITVQHRYAYHLVSAETIAGRPAVAAFREWLLAEAAAAEGS